MKLIRTEDAVGHVLCHDMTQIIPGVIKDARFRKGHIVTEEDLSLIHISPVRRRRCAGRDQSGDAGDKKNYMEGV